MGGWAWGPEGPLIKKDLSLRALDGEPAGPFTKKDLFWEGGCVDPSGPLLKKTFLWEGERGGPPGPLLKKDPFWEDGRGGTYKKTLVLKGGRGARQFIISRGCLQTSGKANKSWLRSANIQRINISWTLLHVPGPPECLSPPGSPRIFLEQATSTYFTELTYFKADFKMTKELRFNKQ